MEKVLRVVIIISAIVTLSGCVTVNKVVRERVDQNLAGNRGYLQGQGSAEPSKVTKTTREYIDVKVELPTWEEMKGKAKPAETEAGYAPAESESEMEQPAYSQEQTEEMEMPMPSKMATTYKVKEGDSLSRIAKKFYGKASKWTLIYEANMDKIKDPERVKPGIELIIPGIEEESKYIK